jgi:hypothetical protein
LKYLYLLFSDDDHWIRKGNYVFSTEAHIFPILRRASAPLPSLWEEKITQAISQASVENYSNSSLDRSHTLPNLISLRKALSVDEINIIFPRCNVTDLLDDSKVVLLHVQPTNLTDAEKYFTELTMARFSKLDIIHGQDSC